MQYDQKTATWDIKTVKSAEEALAWWPDRAILPDHDGEQPDWWETTGTGACHRHGGHGRNLLLR